MMSIALHRRLLLAALAAGVLPPVRAGEGMPGDIRPPRELPPLRMALDDGRPVELRQVLGGRVTALQFVFTGCSSTCSLLGAIFQQLQQEVADRRIADAQLLSFSIDPLGDTPAALRQWLRRFGAGPVWRAVVPSDPLAGADALRTLGAGSPVRDLHAASVLLTNRQAQLVYRTEALPDARNLARLMVRLAA